MKGSILFVGMIALLLGGCYRSCCDTTLYQLSGRQKPIVAVLPVIDHTNHDFKWDLSREFTDEIRKRVFDSKRIYLLRDGGNLEIAQILSTPNPRSIPNTNSLHLGAAEFAVVAEIIDQDESPYGVSHASESDSVHSEVGAVLSLALRVRVLDVRSETPKVVLQELFNEDFVIARAYMQCDYNKMPWGTEAFNYTPMGMAHSRLVREIVSRVEAYIEASK